MSAAPVLAEKQCRKCEQVKPLSDFHRDRGRPDGRQSRCKECQLDAVREYQRREREADSEGFKRRNRQAVGRHRSTPEGRAKTRLHNAAQRLALKRLKEAHDAEYRHLLAVARREVGL